MNNIIIWTKQYLVFVLGFIIILFFVNYIANSARGVQLTNQFFDAIRTTDNRDEVVIIGIDDKSLQSIGAWPWDRSVFANLTKKLSDAGAKVIAYDVLFLEPRDGDVLFKETLLNTQSSVVLGSKLENSKYLSSYLATSSSSLVYSAIANVMPDADGKVRRYPSAFTDDMCIFPLAIKAFNIFTFNKTNDCTQKEEEMFRYPLNVETYSVADILSDKISPEKIKGKTVFIGSTSLDLMDHFVGVTGEKIPGVYVHASIFTSLLNKVSDRNCTNVEILLLLLFYIFITGVFVFRLRTVLGQIMTMVLVELSVVIFSAIFFSYGVILPTPWLLLVVFLTGGYIALFRFVRERKQNQYIQSLFSKYVHKDVLKELMKSGESLHLGGEKREMTILFSDIRGFTTLSESLTPEELTRILNAYLSAMTPPILEEKGTIDKFIGDAIMAFWNAPLYVDNHATHAVRAAISMLKVLDIFNKKNNTNLVIGIGIHTGNVVVGNVGSEDRVNYTVLGDVVNLASRLEGLTKKYGVMCIVSGEVKEKVNDNNILFRKLDVITVKGKNLPTTLYEVREKNDIDIQIFDQYEKAFECYQKKEFDTAENIFKELIKIGDKPAEIMLERISDVRNQKDWDGVYHFDEK